MTRVRFVLLEMAFFERIAEVLHYADAAAAAGERVDLDEIATLIASQVRPSIRFVHVHDDFAADPRGDRQRGAGPHAPAREGATPSPATIAAHLSHLDAWRGRLVELGA